jgi:competence protein ComEC
MAAPHHGSRSSSTDPLVRATAPRWVVAQAGYRNRFDHPDAAVVARYRAVGADVLRTDFAGAIQWRFARDGGESVRRERIDGAAYWHNQPLDAAAPDTSRAAAAARREGIDFEVPSPRD